MSDLVSQVEAIKVEVEHLAKEVEGNFYTFFLYLHFSLHSFYFSKQKLQLFVYFSAEKLMAIQAADELVSWEQQVKSSSETKSLVHRYELVIFYYFL